MWPIVFGMLAALTLVNSWRDENLQPIGVTLVFGYLTSNMVSWLFLQGYMFFETRVLVYSFIEIGIGSIAFMLWMCGGSRALTGVVAIAMLSLCTNVAILAVTPFHDAPALAIRHRWNFATNVCFALECFVVLLTAAICRDRARRDSRRPSNARLLVARHVDTWQPGAD